MRNYLETMFINIKQRCNNPKDKSYKNYGRRGIKCLFDSFARFRHYVVNTLGDRPTSKHKIDRIDNNKSYKPGNLKWSNNYDSSNNRRITVMCEYNSNRISFRELHRMLNSPVSYQTAYYRYRVSDWNPVEACLTKTNKTIT